VFSLDRPKIFIPFFLNKAGGVVHMVIQTISHPLTVTDVIRGFEAVLIGSMPLPSASKH